MHMSTRQGCFSEMICRLRTGNTAFVDMHLLLHYAVSQ